MNARESLLPDNEDQLSQGWDLGLVDLRSALIPVSHLLLGVLEAVQ